ncbi:MAG TPA: C39 family peptidase [archaeon]|nr:C39 family peptidase [archaeon]
MKFPFFKQETQYTCGAASMRMALAFLGIEKTEKQVARLLHTNKVRGTWHESFPKAAERFKLNYFVQRNSSIEGMKMLQKHGFVIIVSHMALQEEKEGHYAVLKKIGKDSISFFDPWFGENKKYSLNTFNRIWKSDPKFDNEKKWLFAVKK